MIFTRVFAATSLLAGVAVSESFTTIDPCPAAPKNISQLHQSITVTAQHQPVSTCTRGATGFGWGTYNWVSTVIPCWGGSSSSSCTVTDSAQIVPCTGLAKTITSVVSTSTARPNGTYVTYNVTKYQTVSKLWVAPYKDLGPLAIAGYAGCDLCTDCGVQGDGSKKQRLNVTECTTIAGKEPVCSKFVDSWISKKDTPSTTGAVTAAISQHTAVPSGGVYTFYFTQTAPTTTIQSQQNWYTVPGRPWIASVTRSFSGPTDFDIIVTVTRTITFSIPFKTVSDPKKTPAPEGFDHQGWGQWNPGQGVKTTTSRDPPQQQWSQWQSLWQAKPSLSKPWGSATTGKENPSGEGSQWGQWASSAGSTWTNFASGTSGITTVYVSTTSGTSIPYGFPTSSTSTPSGGFVTTSTSTAYGFMTSSSSSTPFGFTTLTTSTSLLIPGTTSTSTNPGGLVDPGIATTSTTSSGLLIPGATTTSTSPGGLVDPGVATTSTTSGGLVDPGVATTSTTSGGLVDPGAATTSTTSSSMTTTDMLATSTTSASSTTTTATTGGQPVGFTTFFIQLTFGGLKRRYVKRADASYVGFVDGSDDATVVTENPTAFYFDAAGYLRSGDFYISDDSSSGYFPFERTSVQPANLPKYSLSADGTFTRNDGGTFCATSTSFFVTFGGAPSDCKAASAVAKDSNDPINTTSTSSAAATTTSDSTATTTQDSTATTTTADVSGDAAVPDPTRFVRRSAKY